MARELEEGVFIGNYPCITCDSSDALSIYKHDSGMFTGFCRSNCSVDKDLKPYKSNNQLARSSLAGELGIKKVNVGSNNRGKNSPMVKDKEVPITKSRVKKKQKTSITIQEKKEINNNSSFKGKRYRKIDDKWNKYYGVRTEIDGETGKPKYRYYPGTTGSAEKNISLVGYQRRDCKQKDFLSIGLNSKEIDLFGQFRCKGNGKYLLIAGGQEDVLAAKQMLEAAKRDNYAPVDVVCSTVGETSCAAQMQMHYEFLDGYDNIIVNLDSDNAGQRATEALLEVLPPGKTRVMDNPEGAKDACDALSEGLEEGYVKEFYSSRKPRLEGIIHGEDMYDSMVSVANMPLIPLPPLFKPLQDKLCGGFPYAEIINILAASGVGKTLITNNLIQYWIFNSPYKIGVLSLEAGSGKFLLRLVSGYLGNNIARMSSGKDKLKFLKEHREECENLFMNEDGEERFCLVDDKGELDNLPAVRRTVEKMIRQGGCKVIIIDPIQDILDSLPIEDQAAFMSWQKKVKARDEVTFININHTRKSGGGGKAGSQGGQLTEEDMQGTSALYKSGAVNIILTRDKTAEDDIDRNTTRVTLTKSRDAGDTGPAGYLYYVGETARLYNKADWMKDNDQ